MSAVLVEGYKQPREENKINIDANVISLPILPTLSIYGAGPVVPEIKHIPSPNHARPPTQPSEHL